MRLIKFFKNIKLLIFLSLLLNSANSTADYFAYITDQANDGSSKYLHVVNTRYNILVESVVLIGTPRDLVLSHNADYVFVSTVITEGLDTASNINIVSTQSNTTFRLIDIQGANVRGLALTSDDSVLFVTHSDGITRVTQPTYSPDPVNLSLTYKGISIAISDDDKYLFVIGTDGSNNDGISMVDVESFTEVASHPLGDGAGVSSIVFDKLNKELFVLNRNNISDSNGGELINLKINNYGSTTVAPVMEPYPETKAFPLDSFPIDIALNADSSEIYVALSFIPGGSDDRLGTGNGYITVLNAADISGPIIHDINDLSFEGGGVDYQSTGAIHPIAISFDDSGQLHLAKQMWNEYSGTFLSSIDDHTGIRSGVRTWVEVDSINMGKRSSTQMAGKFVGADCSYCPNGLEDDITPVNRPSAISPFMLVFTLIFLILLRLKRNEINNS
ncbi:MAG: hypothetical protein OEM38_02790 [Gammaproteobacteria bacterium]|nr:hypothetical protein [Gammaproteobacteria bacterium]